MCFPFASRISARRRLAISLPLIRIGLNTLTPEQVQVAFVREPPKACAGSSVLRALRISHAHTEKGGACRCLAGWRADSLEDRSNLGGEAGHRLLVVRRWEAGHEVVIAQLDERRELLGHVLGRPHRLVLPEPVDPVALERL